MRQLLIFILGFIVFSISICAIDYYPTECWSDNLTNNSIMYIPDNFQVTKRLCFYETDAVNITFDCQGGRIDMNDWIQTFFMLNSPPIYDLGDIYYKLQNCTFYDWNKSLSGPEASTVFQIFMTDSKVSAYITNNNFNGTLISFMPTMQYFELVNNTNVSITTYNYGYYSNTTNILSGIITDNTFGTAITSNFQTLNNTNFDRNINVGTTSPAYIQIGDSWNINIRNNTFGYDINPTDGLYNFNISGNIMGRISGVSGSKNFEYGIINNNTFNNNVWGYRLKWINITNNIFNGQLYSTWATKDLIVEYNKFNDIDQNDITLKVADNNKIRYNRFEQADLALQGVSQFHSRDILVEENEFIDCGIYFSYTDNTTIRNNNFTNPVQGLPLYWGADSSNNININHNMFERIGNQTCLGDCDIDPDIFNLSTFNNWKTITIEYAINSVFEYNHMENITGNFRMRNSFENNIIQHNTFQDIGIIEFRGGADNNLFYNNSLMFTGQTDFGYSAYSSIDVRDVSGNNITNNRIEGMSNIGLRLRGASSNILFNNNFINISMTQAYYNIFENGGYAGEWFADNSGLYARDTPSNIQFLNNNVFVSSDYNKAYGSYFSAGNNILLTDNYIEALNLSDNSDNTKWHFNNLTNIKAVTFKSNDWKCNILNNSSINITNDCGSIVENASNINSGGEIDTDDIVIIVDNNIINDTIELNTTSIVSIRVDSTPIVEFDFRFGATDLNTSDISIIADSEVLNKINDYINNVERYILVDLGEQTETKTLYIEDNNLYYICVKDAIVNDVSEITSSCTGTDEYLFTNCIGGSLTVGHISCVDIGSRLKFTGLLHTGILGLSQEELEIIQASCAQTKITIFAAFSLIALFAIVGSAFMIIKVFDGNFDSSLLLTMVLIVIGLAIILLIGYYIISAVSASICLA